MGLLTSKLEKLKIFAFNRPERHGKPVKADVFEAMYNPASYQQTYSVAYGSGKVGADRQYLREEPSKLALTLVLDGTGVDEMGVFAFGRKSVRERIADFKRVTYDYDGAIHESNYLLVEWGGDLSFACRLDSFTIKYTTFDRDGKPLRAELDVVLLSDKSAKKDAKDKKKSSPDLTHSRIVTHGDTLPLLTRAFYGSSARYLDVARFNALDDFRRLTPGQQIFFPPLAALGGGDPES